MKGLLGLEFGKINNVIIEHDMRLHKLRESSEWKDDFSVVSSRSYIKQT